jgi:hypothetical protein
MTMKEKRSARKSKKKEKIAIGGGDAAHGPTSISGIRRREL